MGHIGENRVRAHAPDEAQQLKPCAAYTFGAETVHHNRLGRRFSAREICGHRSKVNVESAGIKSFSEQESYPLGAASAQVRNQQQ